MLKRGVFESLASVRAAIAELTAAPRASKKRVQDRGLRNPTESRHVAAAARIGVEVAAPAARAVDRDSRFPVEAVSALKEANLLSAFVPEALGGFGSGMTELAQMCEALGQHCSSTAMVFAMHQINVACLVRHAGASALLPGLPGRVWSKSRT